MEDIAKKWMDAREEMNRPVREYFHKKWMKENCDIKRNLEIHKKIINTLKEFDV